MIDRLLNKITAHPVEKRNMRSLAMNMMIKSADMPLFTGTELQAFQVKIGLGTGQMGLLASYGQITAVIAYFLLMGFADKIRNRVRVYVWLTLAMAVYPLVLLFIALGPTYFRRPGVAFPMMAVGTVSEFLVLSFVGLVFSVLFVRSISAGVQGRFMSIMGVGGGLLGMACGLISSQALRYLGFPHGFAVAFAMSVGLLVIAAIVVRNIREIPELASAECQQSASPLSAVWRVIRTPEFILLAPPNILRGLSSGCSYFAMAIGMKQIGLGVEYAGYTTMLIFLGGILGTASIGFTVDRYGAGRVLLFANIGIAISLMGVVLAPSPLIFLIFFLTMYMSTTCDGITVPLAHYAIVPHQIIGAFSAVRLLILFGAGAMATATNGYLLELVKPVYVFAGNATLNIITGILFLYAFNKGHKRQPVPLATPEDRIK